MFTRNLSLGFRRWLLIGLLLLVVAVGCITHIAVTSAGYDPVEPVAAVSYSKVDVLNSKLNTEPLPTAAKALPVIYDEPKHSPEQEFTHEEELMLSAQARINDREGLIETYRIPIEEYTFNQELDSISVGDGYIVTPDGETLSYTRVLSCQATAYTAERQSYKYTFSGTLARVGAIAVDPSFIPLGSELYITLPNGEVAYGYAVAEDTGGVIKGNIIDLYYDTYDECIQWGRRNVTVYVLG